MHTRTTIAEAVLTDSGLDLTFAGTGGTYRVPLYDVTKVLGGFDITDVENLKGQPVIAFYRAQHPYGFMPVYKPEAK